MEDKKIERIILKDEDILLIKIPDNAFKRSFIESLYKSFKEKLLPRKNKILIMPESFEISVIGKEKIEEYISHVDLWSLFNNEETEE